jgi:hypothetical protein
MANDLVIQEFRLMGRNDFMVAPNTAYSEQGHRTSVLHRPWSLPSVFAAVCSTCEPAEHVTVCVALNHVSLSFSVPWNEGLYRIVGRHGRAMGLARTPVTFRANHIVPQKVVDKKRQKPRRQITTDQKTGIPNVLKRRRIRWIEA